MVMESRSKDEKSWEEVMRKLLPVGAPLPNEDQLDYSIAVEYQGPPISIHIPMVEPVAVRFESASLQTSSFGSDLDSGAVIPVVAPLASITRPFSRNLNAKILKKSSPRATNPPLFPRDREAHDPGLRNSDSGSVREDETAEGMPDLEAVPGKKRAATVTFDVSKVSELEADESPSSPTRVSPVRPENQVEKKSVCSRCGKGNRLKEKEACFVCNARYCYNCLLKAMGSMPEGRKCLSCIGKPIIESRRPHLGKPSRLLRKVCSPLEVRQIINAEKDCPANQLRAGQLIVNGRHLKQEELSEILGCSNPPPKLKPGKYWYDKDSGLWGKEGEKPDKVITAKLNVGGKLRIDASNGTTKVFINGREITKLELKILKLANVQCPRDTHFWVYEDGSYEEEGQNNIKGNIWGKASIRLLCSVLSLPVPPAKKTTETSAVASVPGYPDNGRIQKIMLLGPEGSGTSTIFKQAKFLYGSRFTDEEIQSIKMTIQRSLYKYLSVLLEARERFEEEDGTDESPYSIDRRTKHMSDWLLETMSASDMGSFFPAREYAPVANEIWRDSAVQETYKRRHELPHLADVAKYFLDQVMEVTSNEYEPSDQDMLYAEGTDDLSFMDFTFDDRSPMSDVYADGTADHFPPVRYQLIRAGSGGLLDGCKWIEMFEDVRAVAFCVALSDYDEVRPTATSAAVNGMALSRDAFESVVRHPCFLRTPFVLLLNKFDVFEEKINRVPLSTCEWFSGFSPVRHHHSSQSRAHQAYYYVAMKFKELYSSITGRKLFVWQTKARDRSSVNEAFKYTREVLKWDDEKDDDVYGIPVDESFYSTTEMSSSPFFGQT